MATLSKRSVDIEGQNWGAGQPQPFHLVIPSLVVVAFGCGVCHFVNQHSEHVFFFFVADVDAPLCKTNQPTARIIIKHRFISEGVNVEDDPDGVWR